MLCRGKKRKKLLVSACLEWLPDCDELPDGHAGSGDLGQLHGPGETLVTLGIVVLEADLELDGFEEVAFLLICGVFQQLLDITTDSGCNC